MSTTFYALRAPVTSVRIEKLIGLSVKISVWLSGQLAGALVAREEELPAFMELLRGEELFVRSAGPKGPVYCWLTQKREGYAQVLDEYGDLHDFPLPPVGYTAEELDRDNPYNAWMHEGG